MTVKGTYPDTEHVKFKTLPAVKVASCVIKGSYDQMNEATATVASISMDPYLATIRTIFRRSRFFRSAVRTAST